MKAEKSKKKIMAPVVALLATAIILGGRDGGYSASSA